MKNLYFVVDVDGIGNPILKCYHHTYDDKKEWGKMISYHIKTCIDDNEDKHNQCYKKLLYTVDVLNNMGLGAAILLGLLSQDECKRILVKKEEWEPIL